jgi:hypothetical protein
MLRIDAADSTVRHQTTTKRKTPSTASLIFGSFFLLWTTIVLYLIIRDFPNIKQVIRENKNLSKYIVIALYVIAIVSWLCYLFPDKAIAVFGAVHLIADIGKLLYSVAEAYSRVKSKNSKD